MSISDFEQSLWELALLINPTHLANITTSKLNSYYQDTILDMRKVVLVQNLFNDIYNNWTDHQIRYQQNRRRQIENGEITEQQLLEEESEENESEIEYMSDEDQEMIIDDERYELQFAQPEIEMAVEENKENIDTNNSNIIIGNDNTVIQLPVRKDSVSHKSNGKPIKKPVENQPAVENNKHIEPAAVEPVTISKSSKDMVVEKNKTESKSSSKSNTSSKEMKKKYSKSENKEQKSSENKEPVKKITLDFSSKDAAKAEEAKKSSESKKSNESKKSSEASEEKESQKKSKKEHSRRKKIEREPRKDSLKANVNLSEEKSHEVIKELQKSGVLNKTPSSNEEKKIQKNYTKTDSAVSLDEKTESSITSTSSSSNSGNSFVIRSFNIPSQQKTETEGTSSKTTTTSTSTSTTSSTSTTPSLNTKVISIKQEPVPARKSSAAVPPPKFKKNYKLSDKDVSIKNKYKLDKSKEEKEVKPAKTAATEQSMVHLRPDAGMPPTIQRRSMDELLFQFADVMDIVSLIPHIVGDDDILGNDLTFNSSNLNSKVQTKDSNGNVVEETPRKRPSRAPTPPPTVVSNGKEYEVYSIPSERHQKYIKKKEEMEKSNKRRSSLKFEYHEFEELRKQQELAGYDTSGDVPVTERKRDSTSSSRSSNKISSKSSSPSKSSSMSKISSSSKSSSKSSSSHKRSDSSSNNCGSTMKMDILNTCMNSSNSNDTHSSSSKSSSSKRSSRFFNLTKSKSKTRDKEKEKMSKENKENISSNSKNYLVRRKSNEKSSSRSHRFKIGGSTQEPSSSPSLSQPSPTLSSVSSSSTSSKPSGVKKSYSSTTLSKYDLPHMSSLSSESSSRRYGSSSERERERERSSTKQSTLPTVKSSPGLFEGIDFSAPLNSTSSSSKRNLKKATEQRSSSTSEIDKFFDNVFRIDWTL